MLTPEQVEYYNKAKVRMDQLPREIEEHLKSKHNGVPATTCHDCVSLAALLRSTRMLLDTLEPLVKKE